MRLADFALERFFARWEFTAEMLLCASDIEGWPMADLLALADEDGRRRWNELALGYTESMGGEPLRVEIAGLYDTLTPDDILVFAGAEEAIFCLHNVLLGPGDHALVVRPAYQSLFEVASAAGAEVSPLTLRESNGWRLDPDEMVSSLRPNTRLLLLNEPHNPSGALSDRRTFEFVAQTAAKHGARLIVDEVYRFLEFDPAERLPAAADTHPSAVSIGVMSKGFGLAGLRIGWVATRDRELLGKLAAIKDYTTICSSGPSEILALIALRAREKVLARNRGIVMSNMPLLDAFFSRWRGVFEWVRPRGGSIGFPRLVLDRPVEKFADELVRETGVLLMPGGVFGDDGNHFRVGFGRLNMPEALARLEDYATRKLR